MGISFPLPLGFWRYRKTCSLREASSQMVDCASKFKTRHPDSTCRKLSTSSWNWHRKQWLEKEVGPITFWTSIQEAPFKNSMLFLDIHQDSLFRPQRSCEVLKFLFSNALLYLNDRVCISCMWLIIQLMGKRMPWIFTHSLDFKEPNIWKCISKK